MQRLGVIADDFTGATDIASFLVQNGLPTVQYNGVPDGEATQSAQAIVVSLKSRSCPTEQAVSASLAALKWLQAQGCDRFYFKYCSTFDSTAKGNIGPVTDALLAALGETFTIISPALPVNGRSVYQGYLFVFDQLLSESGMRHHPVTPMTDSALPRLMEAQAQGRCAVVNAAALEQGADAVQQRMQQLKAEGVRYAVLDATSEAHLITQGAAVKDLPLVTGGSGLAIGLARQWATPGYDRQQAEAAGRPMGEKAVVISGSCSTMTNAQVARYLTQAPAHVVEVEACLEDPEAYAQRLCDWVVQQEGALAPLLYATSDAQALQRIQQQYGAQRSSEAVEALFSAVVRELKARGYQRFIVAGGETSGVVAQTLGIHAFHIGPVIAPGVPWVRATDQPVSLALKSGNFGNEDFFAHAQEAFRND
ncbi:hypothetical protein CIG19_17890 [Enterobacterales bacterium CwR94]|nr:hypothetical protein CIG19_17890 [Enterobacterales bacterium CwR94]